MNAEGRDVISLGIGSPDMPPSERNPYTLRSSLQVLMHTVTNLL